MGLFGPPNVQKMKDNRNLKGLIKALDYKKDWNVRVAAAKALGKYHDSRAVEPLITALKDDESVWVRVRAAKAFCIIRDRRAIDPLIGALKDKDRPVRETAALALGNIGDSRAVEPLVDALEDEDWGDPAFASEALDLLDWEPDQGVAGAWFWVTKQNWHMAKAIGPPAIKPLSYARNQNIAILEKEVSPEARCSAAKALGEIGNPQDMEILKAVISNRNLDHTKRYPDGEEYSYSKVRIAALEAFGQAEGSKAAPLLASILKNHKEPSLLRMAAAKTLGIICDSCAIESLIATLDDNDYYVSYYALDALCKIGGSRAVRPLVNILVSEAASWEKRKSAAIALIRIYKEGTLDEELSKLILAQRKVITSPHTDKRIDGCPVTHKDSGIGVDFPL